MILKIRLDKETLDALIARAISERRPADWQAEVILRTELLAGRNVSEIIGCEHCAVREDGEIVWGAGHPVSLSDIRTDQRPTRCPNCGAALRDTDRVTVGTPSAQG